MNQGFLKVFKALDKFNTDYDFKPWFKTIMINCCLDYLRKNPKFDQYEDMDNASEISVDSTAISKLSYDEMLCIIAQLPRTYRTVFNMYVLDGCKHHEIATALNIEVSTSKSNLSRAKEKLRSMFKENILV